jgi:hypothetical protein
VAPRRLIAPTPLPPRSVAALGRTGRVAGLRGRTLTALLRTADDAVLQAAGARIGGGPSRLGGLRGGVIIRRGRTLLLRRVEYVPGVRVSGTIPGEGAVQLTVSGRRVARGSIRITRTALTGRLGGRRVSLRRRTQAFAARVGDGREDVFGLPRLVPRDELLQQP